MWSCLPQSTATPKPQPTNTPDPCSGATEPGARQIFTLEQITPCLNTPSQVSLFMANNITCDPGYDFREHGGNEYAPAGTVYERGIDDADGCAILQCYILEKNSWDAFMIGLGIETPVGSNVCGVMADSKILTLESGGNSAGPFDTYTDLANHYIGLNWMPNGAILRTIKASLITEIITDQTPVKVLELPWVIKPY